MTRKPAIALAITAAQTALAVQGGSAADEDTCPASNSPNTMRVAAGTPQTAKVGTAFETNLQVQVSNTNDCPITTGAAGVAVTFTAPSSGATGTFSTTSTHTATVGTDSSGAAKAPTLTANDTSGTYTVVATSIYGSASFSLTNTKTGVASAIVAAAGTPQSANVNTDYAEALRARVTDAAGNPVQGATVNFSLGASGTGPGATFLGDGGSATATTDSSGYATSPTFTANTVAGKFTAAASTAGVASAATYALDNLAGTPNALAPGAGATQDTPAGSSFPIPLAVTVTDTYDNKVYGAAVTFTAPTSGPSGTFACAGTSVTVTTDADGVAVAPTFTANSQQGGYIVTAAVAGVSHAAAFSLVNDPANGTASARASCPPPPPPAPTIPVGRVAGGDRMATAVSVSQASFPNGASAETVVIARAGDFPDALAGAPLAAHASGPLLLTPSGSLDSQTEAELRRVLAVGSTVYLLGGTDALSSPVEAAIQALGYQTVRLAGDNHFATAVAIAHALGDPTTVFEATGLDFPDALAGVPAAVHTAGAILLTNGNTQAAETARYLAASAVTARFALGGHAAAADPSAQAIAGTDRYATSVLIAQRFFPNPTALGAASAASFPDALAAGPYLGGRDEPLVLVPADGQLPASVADYLTNASSSVTSAVVFGGTAAVSDYVKAWISGLA
jgi:hypothetical protein